MTLIPISAAPTTEVRTMPAPEHAGYTPAPKNQQPFHPAGYTLSPPHNTEPPP